VSLGGFTAKEKTKDEPNWLVYNTPDNNRRLGVLYSLGSLEFDVRETYGPTNSVQALPSQEETKRLALDWIQKLGISLSDVEKDETTGKPALHGFDSETTYFLNGKAITNTEFRGIRFRRSINGASYLGAGTGGNCELRFGDHAKLIKLSISWRNITPHMEQPTASPDKIAKWIRQGRAVQGMLRMDAEPIDWKTVKSLTVTRAELCYYGGSPFEPSEWLMPFVALWTTVDTGHSKIDVEIDCPVLDGPG
jgi:hypothetical protein